MLSNQPIMPTRLTSSRGHLKSGDTVYLRGTLQRLTVLQSVSNNHPDNAYVECLLTEDSGNTRITSVRRDRLMTRQQLQRRVGCTHPAVIAGLCLVSFLLGGLL